MVPSVPGCAVPGLGVVVDIAGFLFPWMVLPYSGGGGALSRRMPVRMGEEVSSYASSVGRLCSSAACGCRSGNMMATSWCGPSGSWSRR